MKIKAKKNDIKEALSSAGSIAGAGSSPLLITTCLLIEAHGENCTFTGTNIDQTITMTIPCEVIEEGAAAIPAQFLARVVSVSDTDDVVIDAPETNEKGCGHISFGESKYNVSVFNVSDFPKTDMNGGDEWTVDAATLNGLIKNTRYAVSADTTRPVLTHLLFEFRKDDLNVVGTDGRRLSSKNGKWAGKCSGKNTDSLLPAAAVSSVVKMISGRDGEITVRVSGTGMVISGGTWNIKTKIGDMGFPNWRQIVPSEYAHKVTFSRTMLMAKIAQVMVSCPKDSPVMSMKFTDNLLSLYISDRAGSDAKTTLTADYTDGEEIEILVNPYFIQDVLTNAVDDEIGFSFSDGTHPVLIAEENLTAVVMPVRGH